MVVSAAKAVLSILPILTILITMLALCWSAARAGVIGLAVTILVAWLGFGYGSAVYPDYPEFAAFLVKAGIDSISLNPDSVVKIKQVVAKAEKRKPRG